MKKKLAIAALALLTVSSVSGCGGPDEVNPDGFYTYEFIYNHSDGTDMKCLKSGYGVTCDWSNNP